MFMAKVQLYVDVAFFEADPQIYSGSFWVWYWPIMVIYENIIDSILKKKGE